MRSAATAMAPQDEVRCHTIGRREGLARAGRRGARRRGRVVAVGMRNDVARADARGDRGSRARHQPGEGFYVPIGTATSASPEQLTLDEVREVLGPLLADRKRAQVGHDLKYIEVVLRATRHAPRRATSSTR